MTFKQSTMMLELFILVFFTISSNAVTANQKCPDNLSSYCNCTSQSNHAFVSCSYPDRTNVSNVLTTKVGQSDQWLLQYFGIPNNNLESLPDNYFDGIAAVLEVDLSRNKFTSVPEAVNKFKDVMKINLSSNKMDSLNIAKLSAFSRLHKLDVSDNNIREVSSSDSSVRMDRLRELNLNHNNITYIQPRVLLSFPYLRNLLMSNNTNLEGVSDIQFPVHMSAINLNSNKIKTLDTCKLQLLNDLEILDLNNNDLECTCRLASLFHWVEINREDGLVHEKHTTQPVWKCANKEQVISISEFSTTNCNISDIMNDNFCHNLISSGNHTSHMQILQSLTDFSLNIKSAESEHIKVEWTSPNLTLVYGFRITASEEDSDEPFYTSDLLHPDTLSHSVIGSDVKSGNFKICVQAFEDNQTTIGIEDCKTVYIFSSQVIVGILAGVVFIVPFMAILFCILRLDRKQIKKEKYIRIQEMMEDTKVFPSELKISLHKSESQHKLSSKDTAFVPPTSSSNMGIDGNKNLGVNNQGFGDTESEKTASNTVGKKDDKENRQTSETTFTHL